MISPLLTDLYQITMAYGYWSLGIHEREAVFHQLFRKNPFRGNYAVACGLSTVIEFLENWHFTESDLEYLHQLHHPNNTPLFPVAFLDYLKNIQFSCDIDAISEGTLVFPHAPLIRITGPLLQAQLLESTLLNIINFQTLIATKASRVCQAAKGDSVFEFGMRRAQGPDGALAASRASYVGGCHATSNVLAGKKYGIPIRGTHGHSWVTAFPTEMEAFEAYAQVMPQNCILLVDTYDTLQGVNNAIAIGKKLRAHGEELLGIRLDSGDLATLSIQARKCLDEAGFQYTKIIASNSLDEYIIRELKQKKAPIDIWGVGTHLTTAYDQPALDGVYKLSALRNAEGQWEYKLKISETPVKTSTPGICQVRRYFKEKSVLIDVLYDTHLGIPETPRVIAIDSSEQEISLGEPDAYRDLLQPIFRKGKLVFKEEPIDVTRHRAINEVNLFLKTHAEKNYRVGLEKEFYALKRRLIAEVASR